MIDTVLFDLGNTLVRYFTKPEFPGLLERAIEAVAADLRRRGQLAVPWEVMWRRVAEEDHEAADDRVRPLEGRLARIFDREAADMPSLCRSFVAPFFAAARPYDDALPALQALRGRGFKTAIVSNLPWGSPSAPWHEEMARLGLGEWLDTVVFCSDVGWRKPARPIFQACLDRLGARPQDSIFIGDNPRWDVAGPRAMGMRAVLLDRHGVVPDPEDTPIRDLAEFLALLA